MLHMRNVRGSLATASGFEETLLDDGDLNMARILRELRNVGFSGYINPDHIPHLPGDNETLDVGWGLLDWISEGALRRDRGVNAAVGGKWETAARADSPPASA